MTRKMLSGTGSFKNLEDKILIKEFLELLRKTGIKQNKINELEKQFKIYEKLKQKYYYNRGEKKEDSIDKRFASNLISIYRTILELFDLEFFFKSHHTLSNGFEIQRKKHAGIEKENILTKTIDLLLEAQEFNFISKEFYRDHLIHQLRVFLLGCYILKKQTNYWSHRIMLYLLNEDEFDEFREASNEYKIMTFLIMWSHVSLYHDFGIIFSQLADACKKYKELKEEYCKLYSKEDMNQMRPPFIQEKMITELLPFNISDEAFNMYVTKMKKKCVNNFKNLQPSMQVFFEMLRDELDHGLISGSMVFQAYFQFLPVIHSFYKKAINLILFSICFHNDFMGFFIHPLTQLLVICDQLQEWDRLTKIGDQYILITPCEKIIVDIGENTPYIHAIIPYNKYKEPKETDGKSRFIIYERLKDPSGCLKKKLEKTKYKIGEPVWIPAKSQMQDNFEFKLCYIDNINTLCPPKMVTIFSFYNNGFKDDSIPYSGSLTKLFKSE